MFNNSLKIIYFISIIIFFYFVLSTYFSKINILKIQKNIHGINKKIEINLSDLPIVKNDTNNIISYNPDAFDGMKIKKRKIWDLLK